MTVPVMKPMQIMSLNDVSLLNRMYMSNQNENFGNDSKKISWVSILNAIVQAIIAALTALGVSSCANNIAF